jgi:hypothetical protein
MLVRPQGQERAGRVPIVHNEGVVDKPTKMRPETKRTKVCVSGPEKKLASYGRARLRMLTTRPMVNVLSIPISGG